MSDNLPGLTQILKQMFRLWSRTGWSAKWRLVVLGWHLKQTEKRRRQLWLEKKLLVPMGLGLSPTMKCDLACQGCYARNYPRGRELPLAVWNRFLGQAVDSGVFFFVVTGGEPLERPEILNLFENYPSALFLLVTNGLKIDETLACRLARLGNVMPMVSVEGFEPETDQRRGKGMYRNILKTLEILKKQKILFGFSATVTKNNAAVLGSDRFIDEMIDRGCTAGFYNDLIPVQAEDFSLLPDKSAAENFRWNLKNWRQRKPILLVHLPDDEYDEQGFCRAVRSGAMHVNAQGFVEPCPFAHVARENISDCSFEQILGSPFLTAIRQHPTMLKQGDVGCALVSNRAELNLLMKKHQAQPTEK